MGTRHAALVGLALTGAACTGGDGGSPSPVVTATPLSTAVQQSSATTVPDDPCWRYRLPDGRVADLRAFLSPSIDDATLTGVQQLLQGAAGVAAVHHVDREAAAAELRHHFPQFGGQPPVVLDEAVPTALLVLATGDGAASAVEQLLQARDGVREVLMAAHEDCAPSR